MHRYVLIVILLIACSLKATSQSFVARLNEDSLKKVLLTATDTQRVNTLTLLSKRHFFTNTGRNGEDTADKLTEQALVLSKKLNYSKGLGNALLNRSIFAIRRSRDFHATLSMLRTAMPLLKENEDWMSFAGSYSTIGECYHFIGDNKMATNCYDSSALLFKKFGDTVSAAWALTGSAHSHFDLGNFNMAFKTFHDAQEITPKRDTLLQCFTSCQLATLFVRANLPEIAMEYAEKVIAVHKTLSLEQQRRLMWLFMWATRVRGEAFLLMNKLDSAVAVVKFLNIPFEEQDPPDNLFHGNLNVALGDYSKALMYFEKGYKSSQHLSYEIGHACHANGLAIVYLHLKKYNKAILYAKEGEKVSKSIHALQQQQRAIGILTKAYESIRDFKKAYYYNQLLNSFNDSLAPEVYRRQVSLVQARDQLELRKKEAELLSNQNQISQQQIRIQESSLKKQSLLLYIFIAAMMLLVIIGVLVYRNVKLKRRKAQLQQLMEQVNAHHKVTELEKEKTDLEMQALRAQMNPHFIFNCFSSINRFILTNKIEEASDYLTKFSRLIRMALTNSEKTLITLESEVDALRLYLDLERLRFRNAFNYSISFINTIDVNTVYIPPLMIQPFAENAIWHGLMHKKGIGQLEIELCQENKLLVCTIIDNGIGRTEASILKSRNAERKKSMGIEITAGRLALLNKSVNEDAVVDIEDLMDEEGNGCGTRVILKIPYKELTEVNA